MAFLDSGKNVMRDLLVGTSTEKLYYGGFGLDNTEVTVSDTGLLGGGTTIDNFDSSASSWTIGDDAVTPTDNTTTGQYKEGTGSMSVGSSYSTGVSTYYRSVTSADVTGGFVIMWFYISDKTDLTDTTDSVKIYLGTSGDTNSDIYNWYYDDLTNGWNSLVMEIGSADSQNGTGLDTTQLDYIKIQFKNASSITLGNIRFDYLRYYEPDTMGITDSKKALTVTTGDKFIKKELTLYSTESNGIPLVEYGDSTDGSTLLTRYTFTQIDKTETYEFKITSYLYFVD